MREILFRGKNKNGEWVSGLPYKAKYVGISSTVERFIVNPDTVGQYTGLCDKNDNKIFEGDICKLKTGDICTISFIGGCFSFFNVKFGNIPLNDTEFGVVEYDSRIGITNRATDIEVIGNIYDNKNLLEEEL